MTVQGNGFGNPEASIKTIGDGLPDSKTGAMVVNALASVVFLLTRFSGLSHWFQRKTFHHTRDPIYQRLIVAILKGYYVPPLRVAAVADKGNAVVDDPTNAPDWTLIDGLQRTTCYIIAVLMAALGDELVEMGCIDEPMDGSSVVLFDPFSGALYRYNSGKLVNKTQLRAPQ